MKIRTDFVTNSSSSSFVTASIGTKSEELLEAMKMLRRKRAFSLKIYGTEFCISGEETSCGFDYNVPENPIKVIEVLAELLKEYGQSETAEKILAKKDELADSIGSYRITVGETGNSAENECLCEDYVNHIIKTKYAYSKKENLFDCLWDVLLDSFDWPRAQTTYTFNKKTGNTQISSSMSGPLDYFQLENDGDEAFQIDEHGSLIKYDGKEENVVIPFGVTSIGNRAFSWCKNLQSIMIPDGVTSIGDEAFEYCTSLQSITIPNSVTSIGNSAFMSCQSLQSIAIPDSVTNIGFRTFEWCRSLQSVTIPDGVTSIGWSAFEHCTSLRSIMISESVMSIGYEAFKTCENLQSITIPGSVKNIDSRAFENCTSLQSVTISPGVTSIGWGAFENCVSLQSITIPDSVTNIGIIAFSGCESLQGTTYDNAVYLGNKNNPFLFLQKVLNKEISSCLINKRTKMIGDRTFNDCKNLQSVTIPDGVINIGNRAFESCESLQSITISDSVSCIEWSAFASCTSLQSIMIPEGVSCIEGEAFKGCTSLQSIIIPDSRTSIGDNAFAGCTSLQRIISPNISIEKWTSSELKRASVIEYLQKREMFLDADIDAGYKKYAISQRKKLLSVIFKNDMVTALAFYAEEKKITAKNFEEEYLNPAKEANAETCVTFLLDWQNKKLASK